MGDAKRRPGLTAIFGQFLLACGALAAITIACWWLALASAIGSGFVLPARSGQDAADAAMAAVVESGTFDPQTLPHYLKWARFDVGGALLDGSPMSAGRLRAAQGELRGESLARGFPYALYHRSARLADGSALVLQYDYATPYADARWAKRLPDFQSGMLLMLIALLAAECAAVTARYARLLRRDAGLLTDAANAVAQRRLDAPPPGRAHVRELAGALDAIEALRSSLRDSLRAQWTAERREREELASLVHDIRTPLTAIIGHADLLCEDARDESARRSAEAVLQQAERLRAYAAQLDLLAQGRVGEEAPQTLQAGALFAEWRREGEALCAAAGVRLTAACEADGACAVYREALCRAVVNLLDNAVRFSPPGGAALLTLREEGGRLCVRVEDAGPGFSREALASAGHALYTGESDAARGDHRGLGLCQARRAAQLHGGELRLANRPGGGARAEIAWPRDGAIQNGTRDSQTEG